MVLGISGEIAVRLQFVSVFSLLCCLFTSTAQADFSAQNRSINATGETLHEGEIELGLMGAYYGLSDEWMLEAPSLTTLLGYGRVELRRRFRLEGDQRVSPYLFGETPKKYGFGSDYGWDFGPDKAQSLTIGLRLQFTQRLAGTSAGPRSQLHTLALPNLEYDYYARGNVFYAGFADYIPYLGYTWSFSFWNIGLVASPYTSMIPLPYVYIRF